MSSYRVTKRIDGFSTCFRQWRANTTHCQFLHGYGVYFEVTFEGPLDERNWTMDFGSFKRSQNLIEGKKPDEWFKWLLDHTVIIANDDPALDTFKTLDAQGIIQLRILENVGCEKFAEYLFYKILNWTFEETKGRVRVVSIQVFEHEKNSATYSAPTRQSISTSFDR